MLNRARFGSMRLTLELPAQRSHLVGVYGSLVAVVWCGVVTHETVAEVTATISRAATRERRPIAFLSIAQFRAPVPEADVREAVMQRYRSLGPQLACVAQVVEGEGFWAAAARGFIAGIGLLARRGWPMSVFARIPEALAWVAQTTHTELDVPTLVQRIAALRSAA